MKTVQSNHTSAISTTNTQTKPIMSVKEDGPSGALSGMAVVYTPTVQPGYIPLAIIEDALPQISARLD